MRITDFKTIYFACGGNTCRSPMAQRVMRDELEQRGISGIEVRSRMASIDEYCQKKSDAGSSDKAYKPMGYRLGAGMGDLPISSDAADLIKRHFDDDDFIEQHRATGFTLEDLKEADLIICMERTHLHAFEGYEEALTADGKLKVYTLGQLVGEPQLQINDPMIAGFPVYYGPSSGSTGSSNKEEPKEMGYSAGLSVYEDEIEGGFDLYGGIPRGDSMPDGLLSLPSVASTSSLTSEELSLSGKYLSDEKKNPGSHVKLTRRKVYEDVFDQFRELLGRLCDGEITLEEPDEYILNKIKQMESWKKRKEIWNRRVARLEEERRDEVLVIRRARKDEAARAVMGAGDTWSPPEDVDEIIDRFSQSRNAPYAGSGGKGE